MAGHNLVPLSQLNFNEKSTFCKLKLPTATFQCNFFSGSKKMPFVNFGPWISTKVCLTLSPFLHFIFRKPLIGLTIYEINRFNPYFTQWEREIALFTVDTFIYCFKSLYLFRVLSLWSFLRPILCTSRLKFSKSLPQLDLFGLYHSIGPFMI